MTILELGATGATGRLLVRQLLAAGHNVRVIVRSSARLPAEIADNEHLSIIQASILDLEDAVASPKRRRPGCPWSRP